MVCWVSAQSSSSSSLVIGWPPASLVSTSAKWLSLAAKAITLQFPDVLASSGGLLHDRGAGHHQLRGMLSPFAQQQGTQLFRIAGKGFMRGRHVRQYSLPARGLRLRSSSRAAVSQFSQWTSAETPARPGPGSSPNPQRVLRAELVSVGSHHRGSPASGIARLPISWR